MASWPFNEGAGLTAFDAVGNLDGTISGASWIDDGYNADALHFDGNDRVTIADNAVLRSPQLTVRLWVRGDPGSPPADGQVIFEKGDRSCGGGSYAVVVDGDHVEARYREATASGQIRTVTVGVANLPSLWNGDWHQLAFITNDEEWGYVGLYQHAWMFGTSPALHAIDHSGLTTSSLVIGGPANASCEGAGAKGFTGDIDQVRVYQRLVPRSELLATEPVVATSVEIESITALKVDQFPGDGENVVGVRISPVPLLSGRLRAYLTLEDGVERGAGGLNIDAPWEAPADGRIDLTLRPEDGGAGVLRVRWEPDLPQLASEARTNVSVVKLESQATMHIHETFIEGDEMTLGVKVSGGRVNPNGIVELHEVTDEGSILLDSQAVEETVGSFDSAATFTLPPRSDGTYSLEVRYLGGTAHLPSDPWQTELVVHQKLIPGAVLINGGSEVTDNEYVTVALPAVGAEAVQISMNPDNILQLYPPIEWVPSTTIRMTNLWDGEDQDGLKTVWVKWANAKGQWTDWDTASSDSIILDRGLESGTVTINDGAASTASHNVVADVPVDNPSAVEAVQLSNDGETWTTKPYDESINWLLAGGEGLRTVHVRWVDALGRQSVGATDSIVVTSTPTAISNITATIVPGGRPTSTVPIRVSWLGDDSGAMEYEVAVSRNGGAWSTVASRVAETTAVVNLASGSKYKFRVRGRTLLGTYGSWVQTTNLRVADFQESSAKITYRGTWKRVTGSSYWRGASKHASNSTATATFTFKGTSVAWIAPVGRNQGAARVFVDGSLAQTVDLFAEAKGSPRVVFERTWASALTHTIRIEVIGTSGRPRVDLDAFLILGPP
ncbi:MAG TPA: LamG-like jellyroll fold domain-containing protein [Candidatus Limnocylindrales bacterium]|nr:LamG-like jellyroll fold domain-containing protein [Candidatus Limnocylindrales bacterium]